MTYDAPEIIFCRTKFPYEVSYIRRRCRNTETARLPGIVDIGIRTVAESEAPVAFVVTTPELGNGLQSFDVREFEDESWWSITYDGDLVSRQQFLDALADGDLRYLTLLLRKRLYRDYGRGHWTQRRFEDLNEREILSNNHDANLLLARRGAEDVLFCGDRVFIKGLDPVYCCLISEFSDEPECTIDVADPERRPLSSEYPQARPMGNGRDQFDAIGVELFLANEKEKLTSFMESRGFNRNLLLADIKVVRPQNIRSNLLQMRSRRREA
jgi:hypothetical protein